MLIIAIIAIVFSANPSGSAKTISLSKPGDPVPGVDVSVERSPSGLIVATAQTDSNGIAKFTNIAPGKYVVKTSLSDEKANNNYNSAKSNTAGLIGATIVSGSLNFSKGKPGKATINVTGTGPQTIEVSAKEGPEPKTTTDKTKPKN